MGFGSDPRRRALPVGVYWGAAVAGVLEGILVDMASILLVVSLVHVLTWQLSHTL